MSRLPNVSLTTYIGALIRACISELSAVGSALSIPQGASLRLGPNLLTLCRKVNQGFWDGYCVCVELYFKKKKKNNNPVTFINT